MTQPDTQAPPADAPPARTSNDVEQTFTLRTVAKQITPATRAIAVTKLPARGGLHTRGMTKRGGSAEDWAVVAAAAAAALEDLDVITAVAGSAVRETVPEYKYVSDEQLRVALRRNLRSVLTALMERRPLHDDELRDLADTVQERARNGVPLDEYLLAVTTAEATMWDRVWRATAASVTSEQMLMAFALRFANLKTVTRHAATAYRQVELRTAREDHERRALAIRSLLSGRLDEHELREHSGRLGLDASCPYYVVRARGRNGVDSDRVQRQVAGSRNHAPYAAFAVWGDDVVGLLTTPPAAGDDLTVGLAGPVLIDALAAANDLAQTTFVTAWALGLSGVVTTTDLGLRANVQQAPEVGRNLRRKYLAPLQGSGNLGEELLATLRVYLATGSRREKAAAELHVHHNTVRYRLGRFTKLTGADLTDLTTLAELWWLLTDLDLRPL